MRSERTCAQTDVLVAGGRVAGASLALRLARAGVRVCVHDRDEFPSETLSTHVLHTVRPLGELGVLDDLRSAGVPLLPTSRFEIEGVDLTLHHAGDPGACVRRAMLDDVLLRAAGAAGACVHTGSRVLGVLGGPTGVRGVVVQSRGGRRHAVSAGVVVGADGRNSSVARWVGARRYLVTRSQRPGVWAYFAGVAAEPALVWERRGDVLVAGAPTDAGLFLVLAQPGPSVAAALLAADVTGFADQVRGSSPALAGLLAGARPAGQLRRVVSYTGYFRESAGPGWALVGDAGHFKDVTAGQGINDALRQSERLADVLVRGLSSRRGPLPGLRRWCSWRDAEAMPMYWFAEDMGRAGPLDPLVVEMLRGVAGRARALRQMHEVLAHRRTPSRFLHPGRLALAAASRMRRPEDRPATVAAARALVELDRARRRAVRRPGPLAHLPDLAPPPAELEDVR